MLQHPDVSDVLVNGPRQVYVERRGRLEPAALAFPDDDTLARMALWMTARVGRPIGEDRPMVDARLPDGSRLNAVIPPLSMDGVVLSVRRFRHRGLDLSGLAASSAFPLPFADLLAGMVACRLNVLICGGTGSGKTTMMNALSAYVGEHERVITIEDSAELVLRKAHVVRLETRLPDPSGKGEVTTRALVRNALRMRPDRILVGEVRGPEALDMLQAMNTGHEGSMSTIHANSPRDALDRLGTMVAMSDAALSDRAVRAQIGRSIDAIIHVRRLPDGRRVVDRITEVGQLQGDVIATQDILRFDYAGEDGQGRSLGAFVATGVRPAFADRIERRGVHLSSELWRLQMPIR
jgi:pilus assembly protein CpaF